MNEKFLLLDFTNYNIMLQYLLIHLRQLSQQNCYAIFTSSFGGTKVISLHTPDNLIDILDSILHHELLHTLKNLKCNKRIMEIRSTN